MSPAPHDLDPPAMTEEERLEKRRYQAGHAFEQDPAWQPTRAEWEAMKADPDQGQAGIQAPARFADDPITWHDIETLLRYDQEVDDDTFKGVAKDIWNLFVRAGWCPPLRNALAEAAATPIADPVNPT